MLCLKIPILVKQAAHAAKTWIVFWWLKGISWSSIQRKLIVKWWCYWMIRLLSRNGSPITKLTSPGGTMWNSYDAVSSFLCLEINRLGFDLPLASYNAKSARLQLSAGSLVMLVIPPHSHYVVESRLTATLNLVRTYSASSVGVWGRMTPNSSPQYEQQNPVSRTFTLEQHFWRPLEWLDITVVILMVVYAWK